MISMRHPNYKGRKTDIGELRTPVRFYEYTSEGPYPSETNEGVEVFSCMAEVHDVSMKDIELMKTSNVDKGITIRIRDPLDTYQPKTNHYVVIDDFRYEGIEWNIEDVRPSFDDNKIIVIVLGAKA